MPPTAVDEIDARTITGVEIGEIDAFIEQLEEEYTALSVFDPTMDTGGTTSLCTRTKEICSVTK